MLLSFQLRKSFIKSAAERSFVTVGNGSETGSPFQSAPGPDGTGLLFRPFVEALERSVETQVVAYPVDQALGFELDFSDRP